MSEIQSAVQWLTRLVVDEARYLHKVEGKVKELRNEFIWMQCFLRDIDENHSNGILSRRWISQFREFSNEIEDTIDTIRIVKDISSRGRQGNIFNRIEKYSKFVMYLRLLHRIGSDIKDLKRNISLLTSKINTYGIELRKAERSSSYSWLLRQRYSFNNSVEDKIIGRDEILNAMVTNLLSRKCRVVSICGDGGIGKTFMAEKVFYHEKIRKHFDAFAWAYVSQPCRNTTIYSELLSCLSTKTKEYIIQLTNSELKSELHKVLRISKCLVVLDGLWAREVWDSLQKSFPKLSPDIGSKLLITTRQEDVAKHVLPDVYIHRLQPLNENQSMQLLKKKLEDQHHQQQQRQQSLISPKMIWGLKDVLRSLKYLEDDAITLLKDMLVCCEGFPLAITVLAGVLATKEKKEWKKVLDYIKSLVVDEDIRKWGRILELSYYDLPYQLKPCFLYMGYFLKNLQIPVKKIIRLWEAEDLVSSAANNEISKGVAENCLSELVERSLVQVVTRDGLGKPKTCILHDVISGLCMAKASQENWLSIVPIGGDDQDQLSGMFTNYQRVGTSSTHLESPIPEEVRIRRLAIYYITSNPQKLPFRHMRYVRSMLFFNTLSNKEILAPLKRYLRSAFDHWTLLRVLHVENIEVHSFPKEVGNLIYLRYLSLRGSWISKLPSTIQNLRFLQTLDLRVLSFVVVRIPNVLSSLERLLHLYLPSKSFILRHKAKNLQLKGLKKLETLSNFSNQCRAEDVASLSNLRRFSSSDFLSDAKSIEPLIGSHGFYLEHLVHVSLCLEGKILKLKPKTLAKCYKLKKLWVKGEIYHPITHIILPQNLIQLSFHDTKFQSDPMEVLEKLPSLKKLSLKHASYTGVTLKCSKEKFPNLEYLTLRGLEFLDDWTVEEAAMPKLSHLKINSCQKLKMLPDGLRYIESLKELVISFMPFSFFDDKSPKDLTEWAQYPKVDHIPHINVFHVLNLEDDLPIEFQSCQGISRRVPEMY